MLESVDDAFDLLKILNADPVLLRHAEIVYEVAQRIVHVLSNLDVKIDKRLVFIGAVLHDAGKTIHENELHETGHQHEKSGKELLLSKGVALKIAQICETHARWDKTTTLEDLVVALADELWKGRRNSELEQLVIRRCADQLGSDYWQVFIQLDTRFEKIAADGHIRSLKSRE